MNPRPGLRGHRKAAGGLLNYYVGGDQNVLERVRPLLESSSNSITYLGQTGAATVLKIATNMISATTVAILAEALSVCETGGVELDKMSEAMKVNACSSGLSNMKLPTGPAPAGHDGLGPA